MVVDFSQPAITQTEAQYAQAIRDIAAALAVMLDGVTASNVPTGAIRWSTANSRLEKFDGTTWAALCSLFDMSVLRLNGYQSTDFALAGHTHAGTYQPLNAALTILSGLTPAADKAFYYTGADAGAFMTVTSAARTLLAATTAAAQRTVLGLAIGSNVQAYSAVLAGLAAAVTEADELVFSTGPNVFDTCAFPAQARTLLAATTAALQRGALELGNAAVLNAGTGAGELVQLDSAGKVAESLLPSFFNLAVTGAARKLVMSTTGVNAAVSLTADELVVKDNTGKAKMLTALSLTENLIASKLDTGVLTASTWYYAWVFAADTGPAIMRFSLSATSPVIPSGYTYKARVGTGLRTDSTANKFPLPIICSGSKAQYKPRAASNLTAYPIAATGPTGSVNASTFSGTETSLAPYIPGTAVQVKLHISSLGYDCAVHPNNNCAGWTSVNPPAVTCKVSGSGNGNLYINTVDLQLESMSVYFAAVTGSVRLFVMGWEE